MIDKPTGFRVHGWSLNSAASQWYQEQLRRGVQCTLESSKRDVEVYTCEDLMKGPAWSEWVELEKPFKVTDIWNPSDTPQVPFTKDQPCFIQLGRYGDLILLFPAFQEVKRRTGVNPVVVVSREYADVFEGISYATPLPVPWPWWEGVPKARQLSSDIFGQDNVLQCHGADWGVDMSKSGSFMESMWQRAEFDKATMLSLPLEFDSRNREREAKLVSRYKSKRPLILTKFFGISSPFNYSAAVTKAMSSVFGHCDIVNLDSIKAERIFDLLGLIDVAAGLITMDTSILHLAAGSKTPYIAFSTEGWNGSIPKGNCVFNCRYSEVPSKLQTISETVTSWIK